LDESRVIISRRSPDGERIIAIDAKHHEVTDIVIADALNIPSDELEPEIIRNISTEDRAAAITAAVTLQGSALGRLPASIKVYGQVYEIDELPEEPEGLLCLLRSRAASGLLHLNCSLPGPLKFEIWPNERTHRGRPHCRVTYGGKQASYSIPDGKKLSGDLRPKESLASRLIRQHGEILQELWIATRPDDQALQSTPPT
jgi:hypothetical protein